MNCWKLMMWNLQVLKWISSRAYVLSHRTFAPQPLFVFTLSEYSIKKSDARHLTCPLRNIKDLIATLQFDFETGRLLESIKHWLWFMHYFLLRYKLLLRTVHVDIAINTFLCILPMTRWNVELTYGKMAVPWRNYRLACIAIEDLCILQRSLEGERKCKIW